MGMDGMRWWLMGLCALFLGMAPVQPRHSFPRFDNLFVSPCPDTFNYFLRDNSLQYGVIRVRTFDETTIQLYVELSVGNSVQGFNGALVLADSKSQTIDNILARRPITYRLDFPQWFNYPPKITKILLNGRLLCEGPPIDIKLVRILTTINLQHTLRLNIPHGMTFDHEPHWHNHPEDNEADHQFDHPEIAAQSSNGFSGSIDFQPSPPDKLSQQPSSTASPPITNNQLRDFTSFGINLPICGISFTTNTLIANGRDVQMGQFPWLVAIFLIKGLGPEFLCGASLISSQHVLTAGHCMKIGSKLLQPEQVFLRLGGHNLHQWTQAGGARTVGASRITVHEDYKLMSADGDVALLHLDSPLEFDKVIRPVCLWTEDTPLDRVVGAVGTVVGWGKDEQNHLITPTPKQVAFPVVSQESCLRSHFAYREITSDRTFCAGYRNGSGPCNGDSGGGFLLETDNRWTLRGIVSMSIGRNRTCDYSQYFVFTDIARFLDWIRTRL